MINIRLYTLDNLLYYLNKLMVIENHVARLKLTASNIL